MQVLCITLNAIKAPRVKQRQALSPHSIISSLSGLAKQGDSFFKSSCSSNSEGVGKPFLLMKGWKQKHKSANIEKQCQMVIFFYVVLFALFHMWRSSNKSRDYKHEMGNTEWLTLIHGLNDYERV